MAACMAVCVSLRCTEYGEFMFSYGPWMYYNKPTWNTSSEALLMTAIQFYSDFSYFSQYFSTQHTEWPSSIFWYLLLVMVCSYFTVSERREEKTKKNRQYKQFTCLCKLLEIKRSNVLVYTRLFGFIKCVEIMRERYEIGTFSHEVAFYFTAYA